MRRVDRPEFAPMHCAALPYIDAAKAGELWVDTGIELNGWPDHIYLSGHGIRQAMGALGWPSPEDHEALRTELAAVSAELAQAQAELVRLQEFKTAVDAMVSEGYRARHKPGPAKKPERVS